MAASVISTLLYSAKTPAGVLQLVDHRWDSGAEIEDYSSEPMVRFRLWPSRLAVRGRIDPGHERSFGQLMLIPPSVVIRGRGCGDVETEMARTLEFTLDHHWLRELPIDSADWSTADPNALLDLKNLNIEHSLRRISEEISHPQRDSDSMISALAESIGIDISRTLTCQSKASCTSDIKGTLNKAKLHFIQDFILSYQDGSPNLADVANECGFSVAHLRRIFKNTVGKTLYEFIEEIRMERAQQLLREPTLQLKAIAYRLGYAQPSAFASAFKKAVGESPSDYRSRFESSPPSSNT